MASYNFLTNLIPAHLEVDGSDKTLYNALISTAVPLGAAAGALGGSKIASIGRRPACLILNVIIGVGIGVSLIESLWSILLGRLIYGFGAGTFSVITPMFIAEVTPVHLRGPLGIIS